MCYQFLVCLHNVTCYIGMLCCLKFSLTLCYIVPRRASSILYKVMFGTSVGSKLSAFEKHIVHISLYVYIYIIYGRLNNKLCIKSHFFSCYFIDMVFTCTSHRKDTGRIPVDRSVNRPFNRPVSRPVTRAVNRPRNSRAQTGKLRQAFPVACTFYAYHATKHSFLKDFESHASVPTDKYRIYFAQSLSAEAAERRLTNTLFDPSIFKQFFWN